MKAEKIKGFTLVELLTVIAIVAMLIGLLMPALNLVRKLAKEVKQKAQIGSIEIGLNLYRNDFGQYPPSHGSNLPATSDDYSYTGAQTLAEAMFGQDLLGVHPNTIYRYTGWDNSNTTDLYPPDPNTTFLAQRKVLYLDRSNISVFEPGHIFKSALNESTGLKPNGHMICDTFTVNKSIAGKQYKIGTPLLYFRANLSPANTQSMSYVVDPPSHTGNIYNYYDNYDIILTGNTDFSTNNDVRRHKFIEATPDGSTFYDFIRDPMIPYPPTRPANCWGRPVRPDSFLLISAGSDGVFGTKDDICNFEPNIK